MGFVVLAVEPDAPVGVRNGLVWRGPETLHEGVEDPELGPRSSSRCATHHAWKSGASGRSSPSSGSPRKSLAASASASAGAPRGSAPASRRKRRGVHLHILRLELHGLARRGEPLAPRFGHDGPEPRQAPAERPARIVHAGPEEPAEPLARVLARSEGEVREERPRLSRARQHGGRASARHLERAQDPDPQRLAHRDARRGSAWTIPRPRPCGDFQVPFEVRGRWSSARSYQHESPRRPPPLLGAGAGGSAARRTPVLRSGTAISTTRCSSSNASPGATPPSTTRPAT